MTSVKKQSGFTLLELLIVVAVISILAASAASGFGSSLADGKTSDLAEDLVRIGRAARSRPVGTGMAHRLVYLRSATNGLGVLRLDEGNSNLCNLAAWPTAIEAVNAIEFTGGSPNTPPPAGKQVIDFSPANATPQTVEICYEPTGATLLRVIATARFTEGVVVAGAALYDVVFQVTRTIDGGASEGVVRGVVFPFGGSARIQRLRIQR